MYYIMGTVHIVLYAQMHHIMPGTYVPFGPSILILVLVHLFSGLSGSVVLMNSFSVDLADTYWRVVLFIIPYEQTQ